MQIAIKDNDTIKCVQERFNEAYPYLWIDFFISELRGVHSRIEKISPLTMLKNASKLKAMVLIDIDGKRSVAEVENDFSELLGLNVKVFRKSGNVWVGTSYTGNWTLENQNSEGEQIVMD